jgi:hypothetical protein
LYPPDMACPFVAFCRSQGCHMVWGGVLCRLSLIMLSDGVYEVARGPGPGPPVPATSVQSGAHGLVSSDCRPEARV